MYLNPILSTEDKKQNQIACFLPMEKVSSGGAVDYGIPVTIIEKTVYREVPVFYH